MNFAQVKGITIPQGAAKQLSQGQTILWKKRGGVPDGYLMLTGIEFDGQVWYDTNMYLQGADTLKFAFEASIACNVLGCYTEASAQTNFSLYVSTSSTAKYLRYNGGAYNSSITANTRYDVTLTPTGSDGMKVDSTWAAKTFTAPTTMMIGTTSRGATSAKLTGALYGDIEIVGRERIIPVERISDGAIGYWMENARVFIANQGTGTPVSLGYLNAPFDSRVEWIESTGTQYIDTGITGNATIGFEVKYILRSLTRPGGGSATILGARASSAVNGLQLSTYKGSNTAHYGTTMVAGTLYMGLGTNDIETSYVVKLTGNKVYLNDVEKFSVSSNAFTTPGKITLFALNENGTIKENLLGCIKDVTFFNRTTLDVIAHFLPVRIGQTGYMYEEITGRLFGNDGTGSFLLGQDI